MSLAQRIQELLRPQISQIDADGLPYFQRFDEHRESVIDFTTAKPLLICEHLRNLRTKTSLKSASLSVVFVKTRKDKHQVFAVN